LEKTIAQLAQEGAWSDGIEISVMPTFGSHVGGEETALLNVIEGRRGEVRLRPPEPEVAGVFGLPTLMETAETFALLPDWLRYGRDDGHRLATLRLSDERTGMVEIDSRVTLRDLIDGFAEPADLAAPAWLFGGPFGSLVFEDHLDLPLNAPTLREERIHPGNWSIEPIRPGTSFNE
ncbi:MAG: hypothetical protein KDL87_20450, partial [Verrucomicrobiae bacterium]|nr:hypothetical protein [Verrucomicrobiae bacterium]